MWDRESEYVLRWSAKWIVCARSFNLKEREIVFCFAKSNTDFVESFNSLCLGLFFFSKVPSEKILRAGKILRNTILSRAPHMIRDRKYHLKTYRCVSWLYRALYIFMPAILWFVIYALPCLKLLCCCFSLNVIQSLMGLLNLFWSNLTGNWVSWLWTEHSHTKTLPNSIA